MSWNVDVAPKVRTIPLPHRLAPPVSQFYSLEIRASFTNSLLLPGRLLVPTPATSAG